MNTQQDVIHKAAPETEAPKTSPVPAPHAQKRGASAVAALFGISARRGQSGVPSKLLEDDRPH